MYWFAPGGCQELTILGDQREAVQMKYPRTGASPFPAPRPLVLPAWTHDSDVTHADESFTQRRLGIFMTGHHAERRRERAGR